MSETSWVLKGIDPAARQQAIDEAARRGVSLADHLTDIVLQNALAEQLRGQGAALLAEADAETDIRMPSEEPREGFAIRHRLKALEKRLSASVGSIDGTLHALDGTLFDLTSRIGDVEALAGDSAHSFAHALQDVHGNLGALLLQLGEAEERAHAHADSNQAAHHQLADACGELDQRIDTVEQIARGAESAAATLAIHHETLRHAVATDLDALAHQTTERLGESLDHVRVAADAATRHADAAAAHVVGELRALREAIDRRLEENAAETKSRMHAAFVDAADRMATLADRVLDNERSVGRAAEQLRGEISNVEDVAQTALEETADGLRRADATLAADLSRAREATRAEIEGLRADLTQETDDMRERHLGALARLAQVEAALAANSDDTGALRDSIATRIAVLTASNHDALAQAESAWRARFDAVAERLGNTDQALDEVRHTLSADTQRVEACTLAALEKLNADRTAGDAGLQRDLDGVFTAVRASIADARNAAESETAALRGQHAGLQARLDVVDTALTAITPLQIAVAEIPKLKAAADAIAPLQVALARIEGTSPDRTFEIDMQARLTQLERTAAEFEADDTDQRLRARLDGLAAQLAAHQRAMPAAVDEVSAQVSAVEGRLAAQESTIGAASDNLHNVVRMLSQLSTHSAETETQTQERLHTLEVGFADLRLGQLASTDHADKASIETIAIINARIAELEASSAGAVAVLQEQIAEFIGENDRRLAKLGNAPVLPEAPFVHIEARLDELELRDLGAEFIELRRRIDDRILGLEQRSITALERVCESVAMIEKRMAEGPEGESAARSA